MPSTFHGIIDVYHTKRKIEKKCILLSIELVTHRILRVWRWPAPSVIPPSSLVSICLRNFGVAKIGLNQLLLRGYLLSKSGTSSGGIFKATVDDVCSSLPPKARRQMFTECSVASLMVLAKVEREDPERYLFYCKFFLWKYLTEMI